MRVYRDINGAIYVELPTGAFLVVQPDGNTEERLALPGNAALLVSRGAA